MKLIDKVKRGIILIWLSLWLLYRRLVDPLDERQSMFVAYMLVLLMNDSAKTSINGTG